jgi:ABC-type transport system involved in multi-copper enzyme maturation permease subunit
VSARNLKPQAGRVMSLAVRARDVLLSEWTKVRSVRSTYWILLIAAITAIGGSVIVATATASSGHSPMDPLASIFLAWLEYPVLAVGILGVLAFTSEYSTGQIRTTFAAVPQRRAVLAAKAGAIGLLTLCFSELLAFISFFLSEAILSGHHRGLSVAHPGVVGAVLAAGFSLFAIAMVGLSLGAIIRHTAGAIIALPAVIYLPLVLLSLPAPWADKIGQFTLLIASSQTVSLHPKVGLLSPTFSILVVAAWPAVSLLIAGLLITRRDT